MSFVFEHNQQKREVGIGLGQWNEKKDKNDKGKSYLALGKRLDNYVFTEFDNKVEIVEIKNENSVKPEEFRLQPPNGTKNQEDIKIQFINFFENKLH